MNMKLSIIISTINRSTELRELLLSIETYVLNIKYEVIIVDQNPIGFLEEIVNEFKTKLNLKHHIVSFKGLSKAKNFGVSISQGEFLSFPDDDCKIFDDTYLKSLNSINSEKADIVFGRCIDFEGNDSVLRFNKRQYFLNKDNILGGFVEATGTINRRVFEKGYFFDENMGAGCFHGAEEGYDWLYRILINLDIKVLYNPEIIFYHPQVLLDKGSVQALKRVFTYSCGTAYLCRKHKFYLRFIKRLSLVTLSLPVYAVINRKKAKYYFAELLGLLSGLTI